jgi:hypothetical protein
MRFLRRAWAHLVAMMDEIDAQVAARKDNRS